MVRNWSLLDRDGRVIVPLMRVPIDNARRAIQVSDESFPENAPHYVALAGGDP